MKQDEIFSSPFGLERHRPNPSTITHTFAGGLPSLQAQSSDDGTDGGILTGINPFYALPYLIFLGFAVYCSSTEPLNASNDIIAKYIADPLNPGLGSSLFEVVFNTLGLVPLPMAFLLMPGAKNQRFSAVPFLFGSAAAGYGSLGLYMMTRKSVTSVDANDLGWFTKNVLENKIFNWAVVAALANTYLITGAGEALLTDSQGAFNSFRDVISGSALGCVSTIDLTIICLTGASLVPEDLERRGFNIEENRAKAYAIAASTLLVPAVGLAIYASLRPSLEEK